jgi:hypothetical protein
MKVYTTSGRRIKHITTQYDRFIQINIQLGTPIKDAIRKWQFLNQSIEAKIIFK